MESILTPSQAARGSQGRGELLADKEIFPTEKY